VILPSCPPVPGIFTGDGRTTRWDARYQRTASS
jgi:hypothetical protein